MAQVKERVKKPVSFYLLALLLFLLPWQTRLIYAPGSLSGGFWEYGTRSLYGIQILLGLVLVVFLIEKFKNPNFISGLKQRAKVGAKNRLAWLGLVLLYLGFVYLKSALPYVVEEKYFQMLLAVCLGLMLLIYKKNYQALAMAFWLGGVGQGLLAAVQFFSQEVYANKWLGLASHKGVDLGSFVVEFGDQRWLRAYGAFGSPNILGGFLAVTFILGLWLYLKAGFSYKKIGLMFGELVILAGLILSFSRAAWLALVVGVLVTIIYLVYKKMWGDYKFEFGKIIFYCVLLTSLIVMVYKPLFVTRVQGKQRLEVQSDVTRKVQYAQWVGIMKNNLWFGTGPGLYTRALYEADTLHPVWYYQPIHNTLALFVVEWGLVGLLVWLVVLWRVRKVFKWPLYWPILFVFLVTALLDHYWWSLNGGLMCLSVLIFLANFDKIDVN